MGDGDNAEMTVSGGVNWNISVLNLAFAIFIQSSNVLINVLQVALSKEEASFTCWKESEREGTVLRKYNPSVPTESHTFTDSYNKYASVPIHGGDLEPVPGSIKNNAGLHP